MKLGENKKRFLVRPRPTTTYASPGPATVGDAPLHARGAILHPTDYAEPSRRAFDLACRLARDRGSRLIVTHVAETVHPGLGMAPSPPLPAGYRDAWESRLRMVGASDPSVKVEHRLEAGDPAHGIVRVARETASGLIVMGTSAPAGWMDWRTGGVTAAVRRAAPCPVLGLTVPLPDARRPAVAQNSSDEERMLRVIVHPTDFSPPAACAFEVARSLARDADAELIVVHVAPIPRLYTKRGYREEMEAALRRLTTSDPTVRMRGVLLAGDPVPEILWMDREGPCDLIVMGTRGHTGWRRLWHGSVARDVRRRASSPVLTVALPPAERMHRPGPPAGKAVARNGPSTGPALSVPRSVHGRRPKHRRRQGEPAGRRS